MLDVITTSFYIKSPDFSKEDFELYSTALFDEWDAYVEATLDLPDYALTLIIEEGSIKGRGRIAATAAVLFAAITGYGSLVESIKTIREHANYVSNALFTQSKRNFGCSSSRGNSSKTGGEIVFLENLFVKVQSGRMTPEQAMRHIEVRWQNENPPAQLIKELQSGLQEAPRYPEQMTLPDDDWDVCLDAPEKDPRTPTPRAPDPFVPTHYRIEISRTSKGDKKKVKITKVR